MKYDALFQIKEHKRTQCNQSRFSSTSHSLWLSIWTHDEVNMWSCSLASMFVLGQKGDTVGFFFSFLSCCFSSLAFSQSWMCYQCHCGFPAVCWSSSVLCTSPTSALRLWSSVWISVNKRCVCVCARVRECVCVRERQWKPAAWVQLKSMFVQTWCDSQLCIVSLIVRSSSVYF